VEFVDFIPTLGDLVGIDVAPNLEGTSFAPLLANPERPGKSAVFMVHSPDELGVRNQRYRYLELKNGPVPVALYDLQSDPWETVNLAGDPSLAGVRAEMAALLRAGWKAARPVNSR
jgi:arylsulfatase A-like enzyme